MDPADVLCYQASLYVGLPEIKQIRDLKCKLNNRIAAFLLALKGFKMDFSFNLQATVVFVEDLLVESLLGSV